MIGAHTCQRRRRASWTSMVLAALCLTAPAFAAEDAASAFEKVKGLAGTWSGATSYDGETWTVIHQFRVSANGTVVMETMNPGTEHEMINMYHLDGEDLVLTHYCGIGNQPTMKLARPLSAPNELRFDFTGGTNLDPAVDHHVHSGALVLLDADTIETSWTGYDKGKDMGTSVFKLSRQTGAAAE